MDLNYLLHREQVERIRAMSSRSIGARRAHDGLADLYRQRILAYRLSVNAPASVPRQPHAS